MYVLPLSSFLFLLSSFLCPLYSVLFTLYFFPISVLFPLFSCLLHSLSSSRYHTPPSLIRSPFGHIYLHLTLLLVSLPPLPPLLPLLPLPMLPLPPLLLLPLLPPLPLLPLLPQGFYHCVDYSLFYFNIRTNVRDRVQRYVKDWGIGE